MVSRQLASTAAEVEALRAQLLTVRALAGDELARQRRALDGATAAGCPVPFEPDRGS